MGHRVEAQRGLNGEVRAAVITLASHYRHRCLFPSGYDSQTGNTTVAETTPATLTSAC